APFERHSLNHCNSGGWVNVDRLEAMSLLVASIESGSFSAAGRKLGMPLPTVSRKIADLEARLKTRLLVRSTRKLSLTDAGAAYVASCKHVLELVDEAEAQASGEYSIPRGELTQRPPPAAPPRSCPASRFPPAWSTFPPPRSQKTLSGFPPPPPPPPTSMTTATGLCAGAPPPKPQCPLGGWKTPPGLLPPPPP